MGACKTGFGTTAYINVESRDIYLYIEWWTCREAGLRALTFPHPTNHTFYTGSPEHPVLGLSPCPGSTSQQKVYWAGELSFVLILLKIIFLTTSKHWIGHSLLYFLKKRRLEEIKKFVCFFEAWCLLNIRTSTNCYLKHIAGIWKKV